MRSTLCVPLWVDERCLGALSLYADQATAFTGLHGRVATLLATFAALTLAEAQRADQLTAALINRDVIGQAKGILMERHHITADAAFSYLTRLSQAENTKLLPSPPSSLPPASCPLRPAPTHEPAGRGGPAPLHSRRAPADHLPEVFRGKGCDDVEALGALLPG